MLRVYPLLRARMEEILSAADGRYDPARLSFGLREGAERSHAAYCAKDEVTARLLAQSCAACGFASVSPCGAFVNFVFTAAALGAYLADFIASLPDCALSFDVSEDALFAPLPYTAARLLMFAHSDNSIACPDEPAAIDALFVLFGCAEPAEEKKRKSRAESAAQRLCALFDSIYTDRAARLSTLAPLALAGSRVFCELDRSLQAAEDWRNR